MLEPGSLIAHFRIVRQLGAGGMGQVFLAEDQKLNRQVAIKTLSSDYFDKSEQLDRFYREARTVAQVSHPNVMAIYDLGVAPKADGVEVTYIVMEYVKGQPLNDYLEAHARDIHVVLRISEKIAAGLAAAHKLQIVHRDIKADNILIDEEGEPKILDFGLAKPVAPVQFEEKGDVTHTVSKDLTRAGKIVGTVSYMSPEQVRGDAIDTRSDVFSFGVLLYRMISGNMPFAGPSQVVTLARILESSHASIRTSNESISPELERIIDKCLQKDPNDRYQDTRDLVVDIRNLRKLYDSGISDSLTGSILKGQHSPRPTPAAPAKGKKSFWANLTWKHVVLLVITIPFAFVAIIALGAMIFVSQNEEGINVTVNGVDTNSDGIAILGFENKTGDTTLNWMETGLPEILLTDLTQHESVQIISRERLEDYVRSNNLSATYDGYRKAAAALGAKTILSGSFFNMGERVRIDARLEDLLTGRVVMGEKVVGGDPFALVDSLSARISSSLDLAQADSDLQSVSQLTSSSPAAYKAYHVGMDYFSDGRFDEAINEFEHAVSEDSTFALAYMRIGMANVFQGKQTAGAQFFATALRFKDKLPARERGMLDVYADTWLNRKFDGASSKLHSLVVQYPDDKELRTVSGLFILAFSRDTAAAGAQFDSALQIDPNYSFALDQYGQMYEQFDQYETALTYATRLHESHPNSKDGYNRLARLYRRLGRIDQAIALYREQLERFPDDAEPLSLLATMEIRRRNFPAADRYLEDYRKRLGNDQFLLLDYYTSKVNLLSWQGKLSEALRLSHEKLAVALKTKDSSVIYGATQAIAGWHRQFEQLDSTLSYAAKAYKWANNFQRASYPMVLVMIDSSHAPRADSIIAAWVEDFKERIPSAMWPVADHMKDMYEAVKMRDTLAMITALNAINEGQGRGSWEQNDLELGKLYALVGEHTKAKTALEPYISGPRESAQAEVYLQAVYYLAIAEQGLGEREKAITYFQEYLKYLGNADRPTNEILDAQARLSKLLS